jgi:alkylation response protein AidB-like acyl-CoA dehydrogenase
MDDKLKRLVYDAVDQFCDERITEDNIKNWCVSRGVPHDDYAAFYESELGRLCLPPQSGGWDGPFSARVLAVSRLARRAGAILPYQTDFTSMALLSTMQSVIQPEVVSELIARDGRAIFSQAFSESSLQEGAINAGTHVTRSNDGIFLDGVKSYVANGQFISETLVLTQDDVCGKEDGGMSFWLVPLGAEGVYSYPLNTIGQEMTAPASIGFDHVKLDPAWRIQTDGKLRQILDQQYTRGRVLACAASYGLAQAALDDALKRCTTRRVRGEILGRLPHVEAKLADMAAKIRSMGVMVEKAAESVIDGEVTDEQSFNCSLAKYYVPKTATEVADSAMQIFGGAGYTDHSRVGRIWRDCRGNQIAQGADEMMIHAVAKQLLKNHSFVMSDI